MPSVTHPPANHSQLYRDGKRVLECLQRALRVADACMDSAVSVELFVEILNRYVYYYDQQNEQVRGVCLQIRNPLICLGHHQIHQRFDRAYLFQYPDKPR